MDYNLPVQSPNESLWEKFSGRHIALADQIAKQTKEKNDLGALFSNARMGYSPVDQDRMEKEGRLKELTAQFVESTKDLDDSAYQKASEEFSASLGAPMPQREQAQLNAPNALQSGFTLLAMALDPQNAAQTGAAALNYQQQDQQKRQGENDFAYQQKVQTRNEDIKAKQFNVSRAQDDLERKGRSQDKQQANLRMMIGDVQNSLDKLDQREQAAINQAYTGWNSANTADEKLTAGKRLQALLKGTGLEPSDKEITQAVEQIGARNTTAANQAWELALKNELNAFGEVDDFRDAEMENQRLTIAKTFGIDPANLRVTPSGKTIAAQKLAQAEEQFKFLKSKNRADFLLKWAALQVSKQRANSYAQAVANNFTLGGVRNQISQGHLSMRQYEASVKAVGQSAKSQLQGYLDKLKSESDPEKAAKIRADMNMFVGNLAQEFGLDPMTILKDPLGSITKLMKELDEQEEELQYDPSKDMIPGEIAGSHAPLKVPVPGSAKTKPKQARKPDPKSDWVVRPKK